MGTSLVLEIPRDENMEEVIRDFYQWKLNRMRTLDYNVPYSSYDEMPGFVSDIDRLKETGDATIIVQVPRDLKDEIDEDVLTKLFGENVIERTTTVLGPDKIPDLIDELQDAARRLSDSGEADYDIERILSRRLLPICHYAVERGYGIRLSY